MGRDGVEVDTEYSQGILAWRKFVLPGLADDQGGILTNCGQAEPVPEGVLRRFLSEWTGCNDTLVSEVSKQNCSIASVRHKAAVTVNSA